jgi:cyanate lyase
MTRAELTEKIVAHKMLNGFTWADVAKKVGHSKEWTTAAMMGQMSLTKEQAVAAGTAMGMNFGDEEIGLLMSVPYRGSLNQQVPTDALVYRFYELIQVYGTTIKALIEEEFGDGIMSAIDFSMDIKRKEDPNGDRVVIILNGKFLPYKTYCGGTKVSWQAGGPETSRMPSKLNLRLRTLAEVSAAVIHRINLSHGFDHRCLEHELAGFYRVRCRRP